MRKATFPVGREAWLTLGLVLVLIVTAAAGLQFTRATVLTLAVAPNGGTEPELLRAYAAELARRKTGVQLRILDFPACAKARRRSGPAKADLAVVRPDVAMPGNGLTLAILRELAASRRRRPSRASAASRTWRASAWDAGEPGRGQDAPARSDGP